MPQTPVETLCEAALEGVLPSMSDLASLLELDCPEAAEPLFSAARQQRRRHFGDAIFLYGFVYYSTYCRNNCSFCFYRAANALSPRYRKDAEEVVEICGALAESGVNLIDLTLGEDPVLHGSGDFSPLSELVAAVHRATRLPVMVSPGVVPVRALANLRRSGADFYAAYQETHTPDLFALLRLSQDYDRRAEARRRAHEVGLLVEDGILCGVGETALDRARSVVAMREAGEEQVRAMTLVAQPQTPLAARARLQSSWHEHLAIAVMRLLMPDRLIPASLDVEGISGLHSRLSAGANVVTSVVPARRGLCGVANPEYEIDDGMRSPEEVRRRLDALGLRQGTHAEFTTWLEKAHGRAASMAAVRAACR